MNETRKRELGKPTNGWTDIIDRQEDGQETRVH